MEGPQAVESALRDGQVREVYATDAAARQHPELIASAKAADARVVEMSEAVARAMSQTENPQGLIAVCGLHAQPWSAATAAEFVSPRNSDGVVESAVRTVVVLDRISDPGNAGTIIRSADAAGAVAVVFTSGSVDPHNGKCVRATAGSLFHLPVLTDASITDVLAVAREHGAHCLAADGRASMSLDDPAVRPMMTGLLVWVFGSEAHGVSEETRAAVDASVSIPIRGRAESLNLAAAAAVCLYAPLLMNPPTP